MSLMPSPSIQIQNGQDYLNPDRLTTPIGTYLNNPSTAASGFLGGAQPSNIPQIGAEIGQQSYGPPKMGNTFGDWLKDIFTPDPNQGRNVQGGWVDQERAIGRNVQGGWTTQTPIAQTPTPAFVSPTPNVPSVSSPNNLVGMDLSTYPQQISSETIKTMFPGKNQAEIVSLMASLGYTMNQGATRPGQSQLFVKTGQAATNVPGVNAPNVKPDWVNPSSLAPGQRVELSSGGALVGGTPTTEDQGTTPKGTVQYAYTVAQNLNKKLEAEGAYKWTSRTIRDQDGNWVRVYKKELRKVYSKQHDRKQQARAEDRANAQVAGNTDTSANFNQLVNLRVTYG